MKNLFIRIVIVIIVFIVIYVICNSDKIEQFMDGSNKCGFPSMMNAHGSEPAGFNTYSGKLEKELNETAEHVNAIRKSKSVNSEYTEQPINTL